MANRLRRRSRRIWITSVPAPRWAPSRFAAARGRSSLCSRSNALIYSKRCADLARALGSRVEDALAVNIRGELGHAREEGCTAYAVKQREILIGQNSDITAEIPPLAYVLHLKPPGKPEVMIWTYGGMIGYHGINSAGVGQFRKRTRRRAARPLRYAPLPGQAADARVPSLAEVVDLLRESAARVQRKLCSLRFRGHSRCRGDCRRSRNIKERQRGLCRAHQSLRLRALCEKENFDQSWRDWFPRLDHINSLLAGTRGRSRWTISRNIFRTIAVIPRVSAVTIRKAVPPPRSSPNRAAARCTWPLAIRARTATRRTLCSFEVR